MSSEHDEQPVDEPTEAEEHETKQDEISLDFDSGIWRDKSAIYPLPNNKPDSGANSVMRVRQRLEDLLVATLTKEALGDQVEYDMTSFPMPQGEGNLQVGVLVTLGIKSPIIGQYLYSSFILPSPWVDEDEFAQAVASLYQALRNQRTSVLAQQSMTPEHNGRPHPQQ